MYDFVLPVHKHDINFELWMQVAIPFEATDGIRKIVLDVGAEVLVSSAAFAGDDQDKYVYIWRRIRFIGESREINLGSRIDREH